MIATETRTCRQCGKEFEISTSRMRYGRGLYCSVDCRSKGLAAPRVSHTCRQCGTVFSVRSVVAAKGGGLYCSPDCQRNGQRDRAARKPTPVAPVNKPNRFGQPNQLTVRPARQPMPPTSKPTTDSLVWSGSGLVSCAGCGRIRERGRRCQCERVEVAS